MSKCLQHRITGKGENVAYYVEPKDFVSIDLPINDLPYIRTLDRTTFSIYVFLFFPWIMNGNFWDFVYVSSWEIGSHNL